MWLFYLFIYFFCNSATQSGGSAGESALGFLTSLMRLPRSSACCYGRKRCHTVRYCVTSVINLINYCTCITPLHAHTHTHNASNVHFWLRCATLTPGTILTAMNKKKKNVCTRLQFNSFTPKDIFICLLRLHTFNPMYST